MAYNRVAVVHNGIIENHLELKQAIGNYAWGSETDSEVIGVKIYKELEKNAAGGLLAAVQNVTKKLMGAYSICVLDSNDPENIVIARQGSPLVIGLGLDEYFVASDPLALQKVSQEFIYLEDGDVAELNIKGGNGL